MSFTLIEAHAPVRLYRSKLFVPGSRPSLFEKAAAGPADVVCLDLEDAVAPSDKDAARANIVSALNEVDWR
ncbi:MAG: CoA ester lyase, partial [Alphaproteobacteria bacterium]|nr:CoA ester lyase [Alphaproteobacteria bacterium]